MDTSPVFEPLTLPGGMVLPNRIAKAAMEESMADDGQLPGPALLGLYRRWSHGGAGLLITGNVMVHAQALTGPVGVAAGMARIRQQLRRLGRGRGTRPGMDPRVALVKEMIVQRVALRRYRRWLGGRTESRAELSSAPVRGRG